VLWSIGDKFLSRETTNPFCLVPLSTNNRDDVPNETWYSKMVSSLRKALSGLVRRPFSRQMMNHQLVVSAVTRKGIGVYLST
jgi:hypothetical protein